MKIITQRRIGDVGSTVGLGDGREFEIRPPVTEAD
jgi:hypothetical protein